MTAYMQCAIRLGVVPLNKTHLLDPGGEEAGRGRILLLCAEITRYTRVRSYIRVAKLLPFWFWAKLSTSLNSTGLAQLI